MDQTISGTGFGQGVGVPPAAAELADRDAVRQLALFYALGLDTRDLALAMAPFDPAGTAHNGVRIVPMERYIARIYAAATAFPVTQHVMANQYVAISGDDADMLTYGVAWHRRAADDPDGPLVVGVHYHDRCRRFAHGWRIVHRDARIQWTEGRMPK